MRTRERGERVKRKRDFKRTGRGEMGGRERRKESKREREKKEGEREREKERMR